jgi:type 1 glutamine amidotransferase
MLLVLMRMARALPVRFAMRRLLLLPLVGLVSFVACSGSRSSVAPDPQDGTRRIRVLMFTATAGFRHDSIGTARQVLASLANQHGDFTVTATEDLAAISASGLAGYDVVFFALTSGELAFTADQKSALVEFVAGGKGFLGAHSATDTLYNWPDYGRLVGAYFKEHPWVQDATVLVEDRVHPSTRALGASFRLNEEYYTFRDNPRAQVHVLLSLDAGSVGTTGDYPLAWSQTIGQGRSFYTALGHFDATWNDPRFQEHIRGAINWVGKR